MSSPNPSFFGWCQREERPGGGTVSSAGNKTLLGVSSAKRKLIGSPKRRGSSWAVPTSHSYRRFLFQLHAPRHSLQLTLELKGALGGGLGHTLASIPPASPHPSRCTSSSRGLKSATQFWGPLLPSQARRTLGKAPSCFLAPQSPCTRGRTLPAHQGQYAGATLASLLSPGIQR